ncbi:Zinc transporter 9 [Frankliniella fusca]|uniref:Zinc transporter 9 n=1 Tax=Frankliniella fusca TaxID=407009 RepID=A0AAE1L8I0_9NEOP|nr:Zinc transporter 9 [Frankliniella fusca]KAK3917965.1 Zinc transporter 9 [Frankliniella fusca]
MSEDKNSTPATPSSTLPNPATVTPARRASSAAAERKMRVDVGVPFMERNLMTVERAMADFLLTQDDLEGLKRTKRRSPYPNSPEMVVLSRKDVVQRANLRWGSPEKLVEELQRRIQHASRTASSLGMRRLPRDERRRRGEDAERERGLHQGAAGLSAASGRVVLAAIGMNGGCMIMKFAAWYLTESHSMFSEFLHSVADLANQIIIAIGVHTSTKRPSVIHPYGYTNMKFVSALISGVGIFCVGMGLSLYHGVKGLVEHAPVADLTTALVVMGVSGLLEVSTLALAVRALRLEAARRNMALSTFGSGRGVVVTSQDPGVNVVLTEDLAAVVGVLVASCCLLLSARTQSHVPDAVGSLLVGVLLGAVAVFIITTNAGRLVGSSIPLSGWRDRAIAGLRSIPNDLLQQINAELENDVMVRAIHDVKGIDMGDNMVRYKAELDFDGRQLARAYLDQLNMAGLRESLKNIQTMEDLEEFMLDHGENLVDLLGSQIDRIERKLKVKIIKYDVTGGTSLYKTCRSRNIMN